MTVRRGSAALRALALAIVGALVAQPSAAQVIDSVYTTYDWQRDCTRVDDVPEEGASQMGASLVCPGPGNLKLMLADSDARVSLGYGPGAGFGPWESFVSFAVAHDTVEWRRQRLAGRMQPFATIHRWTVGADGRQREMLVISTVAEDADSDSCIVAVIDASRTEQANRLARRVADRYAPGFVCGNARSRAFGDVGPATPLPRRGIP